MKIFLFLSVGTIVLLSTFNVYFFNKYQNCSKNIKNQHGKNSDFFIHKIIEESSRTNQVIFTNPSNFLKSINEKRTSKQLSDRKDQLFFCFSPKTHCSSCIVETILTLKEKFSDPTKVSLLIYDSNPADSLIMSQKLGYKFQTLFIADSIISKSITNRQKPFIFALDTFLNGTKLFYVESDLNSLTVDFLNKNY